VPSDFGLNLVALGVGRVFFTVGLPIIGALLSPVPLGLPVIGTILPLPIFLAQAFLFPFALGTTTCFLSAFETWMGLEQDGTKSTLCQQSTSLAKMGGVHRLLF
jgi:hypothetical protein